MRLVHIAINLAKQNKKTLLLWGGFLALGLIFPIFEAQADFSFDPTTWVGGKVGEAIRGVATNLLLAVPTFILVLIQSILGLFAMLAGAIMDQVLQLALEMRYIPGEVEDAVTVGWTITRDLANMALILVLAALGIGAILGKNVEQLGSRIATFIGVALLINFTPVITGIIIDLSNILTQLFFSSVKGGWNLFVKDAGSVLIDNGLFFLSLDTGEAINRMISAIVGIGFNFFTMAAFALVSILLIARIVALWLLVILSPLVFVAYILPQTQKLFTSWWKNFWQWSIVGIPLGFFLFLSMKIKSVGTLSCSVDVSGVGGDISSIVTQSGFLSDMCGSIIHIIALATLFVGFYITFQLSAAGSGFIMKAAKSTGTAIRKQVTSPKNLARAARVGLRTNIGAAKIAGRGIRGVTRQGLRGSLKTIKEAPGSAAGKARQAGIRGTMRGAAGFGKKIVGEVLTPAEQKAIQEKINAMVGRAQAKPTQDKVKEFKEDHLNDSQLQRYENIGSPEERAAARVLRRGKRDAITHLSDDKQKSLYGMAERLGVEDEILMPNADVPGLIEKLIPDARKRNKKMAKINANIATEMNKLSKEMKNATDEQVTQIAETGNMLESIQAAIELANRKVFAQAIPDIKKRLAITRQARRIGKEGEITKRYLSLATPKDRKSIIADMTPQNISKDLPIHELRLFRNEMINVWGRQGESSRGKFKALLKNPGQRYVMQEGINARIKSSLPPDFVQWLESEKRSRRKIIFTHRSI